MFSVEGEANAQIAKEIQLEELKIREMFLKMNKMREVGQCSLCLGAKLLKCLGCCRFSDDIVLTTRLGRKRECLLHLAPATTRLFSCFKCQLTNSLHWAVGAGTRLQCCYRVVLSVVTFPS